MKDERALRPTVLLVEPDATALAELAACCAGPFDCLTAGTGAEALTALQENFVEVVLCSTGALAPEGLALLEEIAAHWPETVRIALDHDRDARALPDDLHEVLAPDTAPDALVRAIRNAAQLFRMRRENDRMSFEMRVLSRAPAALVAAPEHHAGEGHGFDTILRAPGSPLNATIAEARILASFDIPVLIDGAPGSGKADLARAIHDGSLRADRPFQALNCAGLSDAELRAELLGVKANGQSRIGLFFKAARGTLYLGGIDSLPRDTQVWLTRVLAEGAVHIPGQPDPQRIGFRIVAGAHRDLRLEMAEGRFSAQLYHALAVGLLHLPPLAARHADLPGLVHHILFEAAARHGKPVHGLSDDALAFFAAYDWPGNLPELRNEITRMLVFSQDRVLGPELISRHILQAGPGAHDPAEDAVIEGTGPLKARVEEIEKRILREVLTRLKWNKSRAATELGLSRVGLRAKLDRYGLTPAVAETTTGD